MKCAKDNIGRMECVVPALALLNSYVTMTDRKKHNGEITGTECAFLAPNWRVGVMWALGSELRRLWK
jgi:hypothetical protein